MSIMVFLFVVLMTMVTDTVMLAACFVLVIWAHDNFQDIEETRYIEYVSDSE